MSLGHSVHAGCKWVLWLLLDMLHPGHEEMFEARDGFCASGGQQKISLADLVSTELASNPFLPPLKAECHLLLCDT